MPVPARRRAPATVRRPPAIRFFDRQLRAPKAFRVGTHRTVTPAETYAALSGRLARFGITRVANQTGLDTIDVPVFSAIRPTARSIVTSQGKGLDIDAARVSAVMESIEMWHAERIVAPARIDSYRHLRRSEPVIDIETVHCLRPPSPELPYAWLLGWDLLRDERCWVPYDAVSINRVVEPARMSDFLPTTSGLASGNHLLEAMAHALCEVIERDCTALWQLGGDMKRVDLDELSDPYCRELVARIDRGGVRAAAWDITSDVGIATYSALVIDPPDRRAWRPLGVYYGIGTHLSPSVALSRALTEAVQSRIGFIAGARDDLLRQRYQFVNNDDLVRGIWEELKSEPVATRLADRAPLAQASFEADIGVLRERLRAVGIDRAVAVDLTQPDIGISVVKVLVPGLEGPRQGERYGKRAHALQEKLRQQEQKGQ